MTQHRPILSLTLTASAAVKPHRAVSTSGAHVSTAGNEAFGVAEYGAKAKETFAVITLGTAKVEAGAAISKGGDIMADANGKAIAKTTAGKRLGIALQAASASGDVIEVFLKG